MPEIQVPFPLKDVPIKPELTGRAKIDETIVQTLAALLGWNGEARRLLTCALSGSLNVVSPPATAVINRTSVAGGEQLTFSDIPTTEIIILAQVGNGQIVWVNIGADAGVNNGWPLSATESLQISVNNVSEVHIYVVGAGDKVVIIRTV